MNKKHIADLIQSEVGWFNGWDVSEYAERKSCEEAAESIIEYLTRKAKRDSQKINKLDHTAENN